ncbi:chitinase [Paenibacillus tuaregi]|uniref:chitinase n=1 Tax=Paenibacillus tuaregi TaxID=1816681 RepID=UPI000837E191|nr:chitinase [Paenibacillus tuaregi]
MREWKLPFSEKIVGRTLTAALGAALLVTPLEVLAAPDSAAAAAASTKTAAAAKSESAPLNKGDMGVGQSRVLNDKQIKQLWNGIDPRFLPDNAIASVKAVLPEKEYEALFPYRLGSPEWHKAAEGKEYNDPNQGDYYAYQNLIGAVTAVANIKYKVSYREGSPGVQEIYRLDKKTKKETLVARTDDFNKSANLKKKVITEIVDFGSFLQEGSDRDRKRDLAALLANLSHETGGGAADSPGGELRWGLFWNQNIAGRTGANMSAFVDPASAKLYPGVAGKRYYGRGPIMMSWNFNYGLISSIIYGDKNVLLKNPESVAEDGKLGFMTALIFWLTPQAPKPSAHDVMVGKWKPDKEQTAKGLVPPGFGVSVMVLNGLEANLGEVDGSPIKRRAGHYRDITARMGLNVIGEKMDTLGMKPF